MASVEPAYAAEMVDDAVAVTVFVRTVNVADDTPAAIVTLAGVVATAVFELVSVTTAPPDGAGALSATCPCTVLPPVTLVGVSESSESVVDGPLPVTMLTPVLTALPRYVAMMRGVVVLFGNPGNV
jgi:hypothetical protein